MITIKEVEKLAQLARIKIDDAEKQSLTKEIASILSYVDEIKKVTIDMDYTPVPGAIHNIFRPDEVKSISTEDRENILKESPDREGEFIAVKKIIAQD